MTSMLPTVALRPFYISSGSRRAPPVIDPESARRLVCGRRHCEQDY